MKYYYKIEDEAGNTLVDGFESVLEAIDYARAHYGKKFGRVVRYIVVPNVLPPATTLRSFAAFIARNALAAFAPMPIHGLMLNLAGDSRMCRRTNRRETR